MKKVLLISAMGLALGGSVLAQEVGRVISSTPVVQDGRTVGYDVQYEYGGRQYSARMPHDPGQTIQLQVSPAPVANGQVPYGSSAQGAPPGAAPPAEAQARILREVPPDGTAPAYPAYGYGNGYAYPYPYPYPAYSYYPYYPYYAGYPGYYYPRYYWPPISLSLGFGYVSGGHGGHGHGGHRH